MRARLTGRNAIGYCAPSIVAGGLSAPFAVLGTPAGTRIHDGASFHSLAQEMLADSIGHGAQLFEPDIFAQVKSLLECELMPFYDFRVHENYLKNKYGKSVKIKMERKLKIAFMSRNSTFIILSPDISA